MIQIHESTHPGVALLANLEAEKPPGLEGTVVFFRRHGLQCGIRPYHG